VRDRRAREIEGRKAEDHVGLIARKKNIVAFVEVKQRETLPTQEDLVTQTNISRIMEAAEIWVERNFEALGADFEIRFDLALIEGRVHPLAKVNYIENAFSGF